MAKPFKFYIGSPLGSGNQVMSWVHEIDLVNALTHLLKNDLEGVYNLTAEQVSNKVFSQQLAKRLNRPILPIGVPRFVLKLLLGEMSDILLTGVKIDSSKLKDSGFTYTYPNLVRALDSLDV
jgi:NAD dependent epimerase/dehydratase family enzyme